MPTASTLDEALRLHLIGDAEIAATVGDAVRVGVLMDADPIAAIVFEQEGMESVNHAAGRTNLNAADYRLMVRGRDNRQTHDLAARVQRRMDSMTGWIGRPADATSGGVYVQAAFCGGSSKSFEMNEEGNDVGERVVELSFTIWHDEPAYRRV